MATETTNLKLHKPATSEKYDVLKQNQNWDKIDAAYGTLNSNLAGKENSWTRLDFSQSKASVSFTIGTTDSPYGIALLIVGGYSTNDHGMYIVARSGATTLVKTDIKAASNMTITMDSSGVVTVARSTAGVAYVLVRPITAGVYFG